MTDMSVLEEYVVDATQYNDIYIRDNFGDTGTYPSSGCPYQSPDIIPRQGNTFSHADAVSTFNGPDQGLSIIDGGVNNIYVRAKNLNSVNGQGTVNLYYADASLFLLPSTWIPVNSAGGSVSLQLVDSTGRPDIAAGSIAISSPSFYFSGFPDGRHFCFIAVVQTQSHPVIIPPSFLINSSFSSWVQNNPAIGWRNVSHHPNSLTQMKRIYKFGNINKEGAYFTFVFTGQRFANGTPINIQCTDQKCRFTYNLNFPEPDVLGNQVASQMQFVPSEFSGYIQITVTAISGAFPIGATFNMEYFQKPNSQNSNDMKAAKPFRKCKLIDQAGNVEDTPMLIPIGECTIVVQ